MIEINANLPARLIPCAGVLPIDDASEARWRERLIAEARGWIGTPYRQLGNTKGVGVDCSMLLVRCVVDIGLVEPFDPRPYPPAWFLHQSDERYIDWLGTVGMEVQTPQRGDFVTLKIGRAFAHSGIISDDEHLVHAFADEGQVSESPLRHPALDTMGQYGRIKRPRRYYSLFARLRADSVTEASADAPR